MKPKIVVTHSLPRAGMDAMFSSCNVVFPPEGHYTFTEKELCEAVRDADAIFAGGPVSEQVIASAPCLKVIGNYGAGYDRVDVAAATARKIPVTNLTRSTALPTAEMALALLLSVTRSIPKLDAGLRTAPPENSFGMGRMMGRSLQNMTIGIVGLGKIGTEMARLTRALGMRVMYTAAHRHAAEEEKELGAEWRSLDDLLRECDVLSLHFPHNASTHHLIGAREISLMKKDAILINTARGGVVDSDALAAALEEGRLGGAGLDVYPDEPHVPEKLLYCPNTVLTPHIGTNTAWAREQMAKETADCILRILNGESPMNVVNKEVFSTVGK